MNLAEVWSHLEADTRIADVPGRVQRRLLPSGRRNMFLGLEIPSRNRMLILRVAANSASGLPELPDSRGLTVRVLPREAEDEGAEVVLALTDSQHRDIFDLLVRDLVAAAEQPEVEREGLRRFIARLSDWQQLLRRLAPRGLPQEAQQGLWGELWALREVVAPAVGMTAAVNGWRGPMGSDQDFHLGATCIEVKTSTAASLDRLAVSSERQLEVPDEVALLLLGLSLDDRVGHGETLPDLVGSVRSMASAVGCLDVLDHRLDLSGYLSDDWVMYSEIGYSLRSLYAFRVGEGFPRIVSGELQPGVSEVRYLVSAASCGAFRMAEERPDKLLEGLV